MRILIADDDVTSRLVLAGVLQKNGHEVVVTADGAEAWDAMQRSDAPRLAILDWEMPEMAGVDVCRKVRGREWERPPYIIILTSRGEKSDIVAGLEAGADDYLAKPFYPAELLARVGVGGRMIELQDGLIEARDALSHEATHDPLTGALNRRAFASALSRELATERPNGQVLAVGICDVDRFKQINDTLGHRAGDEVLCGLVHTMERNLRSGDVLGRYGGDEFVVLTEHDEEADAGPLYERLRLAVVETPVATVAGDVTIAVSFGVKIWTSGETEQEFFGAADRALYQAKTAGRNRVWVAGTTVSPTT